MFDSIDIELASLGRLENVVLAAGQILREEHDALAQSALTFVLSLAERITEHDAAITAQSTTAVTTTTLRDQSSSSSSSSMKTSTTTTILSDFAVHHDTIAVNSDDAYFCNGNCDDARDGNIATKTTTAISTSVMTTTTTTMYNMSQQMHSEQILKVIRTIVTDNNDDYRWLSERFDAYVTLRGKLWKSGNAAVRERLRSSERLRLLINTESPLFDILRTRAKVTISSDDNGDDDDDEWLRKVNTTMDILLATTFLFFQWYGLMAVLPIEYDRDTMNFIWIPERGVVRIYTRGTTFARESVVERRSNIVPHESVIERPSDDDDDDIHLSFGSTFGGQARMVGRLVRDHRDDKAINNSSNHTVVDTNSMLSNERTTRFAVSNGRHILHEQSRPPCRPVAILTRGSQIEQQHCRIREHNGYVELTELKRHVVVDTSTTKTRKDNKLNEYADDDSNNHHSTSNDLSIATEIHQTTAIERAFKLPYQLTEEQQRVLLVLERVLGISLNCTSQLSVSSASQSNMSSVSQSNASSRKRIIIDGVAGAGKTFLLTILLRRFKRVRYLVKKRNFVDAVMKRFKRNENLYAQTIDSFLMRQLGIRNLHSWLRMRRTDLDELGRRMYECRLRPSHDELIFVDEYSLIENSLAEMLNRALCESTVVLVGDCNQQPAIGEHENQPIRTLLGYEHVCFMYDNVRARDINLLARLELFNAKADDSMMRAILGLPLRRTIGMRPFLASGRDCQFDFSLLPRVIVQSNENVNYLNWAIGYLIWHYCGDDDDVFAAWPAREGLPRCMRYQRAIISPNEHTTVRIVSSMNGLDSSNIGNNKPPSDSNAPYSSVLDDPYGDEHFVIEGMRYRMIHACPSWPMQVGSRVIVRRIESRNSVIVEMDDDRRITYRLTRTRVKPYEYSSRWNKRINERSYDTTIAIKTAVKSRNVDTNEVYLYMFPFVMDAATTVYQVQGITLAYATYAHCYIDLHGMDNKALYVTLSRFEYEAQIRGVINCQTLIT